MRPHRYLILVKGDLRATDREWLADMAIQRAPEHLTALRGTLDQSALFGVLGRLQRLAVEVFEVRRICE
jgi:hypothetical protein